MGMKYSDALTYMETQRMNGTLWMNGPPIVLPWASFNPRIRPNGNPPGRTIPLPTHNLSMVHVHKTGGTSLVTAFGSLQSKTRGRRRTSYMPPKKRFNPKPRSANSEKRTKRMKLLAGRSPKQQRFEPDSTRRNETGTFLEGAVKYRKTWGEKDHTVFAVVRDPAERFISAIGQATGAYGSSNNGIGRMLVDECVKSTGRETLRCFVNLMMNNGTWIEVHFTPMAYEISFATMYKDIPVAVFPFDQVPTLMYELNQSPASKKKDGKKKGYRKSTVLTNLTMDQYDTETLHDLCKVYAVDVLFLSRIGHSTTCDPFNID